jgi:hypothetical protein
MSTARFQAWLRAMNAKRFNVYVGVNAIAPGRRSRTKEAISAVRHVVLEADHDGKQVLAMIVARDDLPPPSYVLHSSPNRVHVFWRAAGFTIQQIERLQKHLAHELDTDLAATPASQLTRLPGLFNHKYAPPHAVRIDYGDTGRRWTPADFPEAYGPAQWSPSRRQGTVRHGSNSERAQRYLETIPPAIAGEHGDPGHFACVAGWPRLRADDDGGTEPPCALELCDVSALVRESFTTASSGAFTGESRRRPSDRSLAPLRLDDVLNAAKPI